jgi:phage baseplate assembly protein W
MKDFLGRGIGFPLGVDAHGSLRMAAHEQSVTESIRMILGTAIGERMMRPEFGCRIHDLVFHPNSPNTCAQASLYVKQALKKWEPRVDHIDVRSFPDVNAPNTIQVHVEYQVRRTNSIRNLVFPFYLRREQDL